MLFFIFQAILFCTMAFCLFMTIAPKFTREVRNDSPGMFKTGAITFAALWVCSMFNPFYIVDGGHRGVVKQFGAIQPTELEEGLNVINPFTQKVDDWDVRIFKREDKAEAVSKDLQTVSTVAALNYHVNPAKAAELKQKIGADFDTVTIAPAMQESIKAITAKYTAEELVQKRSIVRNEIKEMMTGKLSPNYIIVDDFSIVNFSFSPQYAASIESKQVADQQSQKAQYELSRIKIEAEQKIASAQAEAESLRLQKDQITPELIKLREIEMQTIAINKWDGKLPDTMAGAMPFLNVQK